MSVFVLDNISWKTDVDKLMEKYCIPRGSDDAERLGVLAREAEKAGKPKALFKVSYIEDRGHDFVVIDGIKFTSRVLRINLEETYRVFPYIVTCGTEIDQWSKSISGFMESYWVDGIKEMALREATRALYSKIEHDYRPGSMSGMNPGSIEDWPIDQQKQLFRLLGNPKQDIGVELTDSCLMIPIKSSSGILFSDSKGFENCRMCSRENCPGRRAPYDPQFVDSYSE
ncbi:MAG: vitamin B12 dependent methionine synthase [Clostridiales bacterium]|mgnify:CR=1 FL=1|jgi:hypothetical protein|nr:vitamin B12 dependent methionine synthase [Clostridiales bacterium]